MQYINPYELLNISEEHLSDIDSALIKKAKKHLLVDVQLNNDKYKCRNFELSGAILPISAQPLYQKQTTSWLNNCKLLTFN
jgi:hypothetical protein